MKNILFEHFSNYKVNFTESSFIQEESSSFIHDFTSDSDEVLCHTSGSTGAPKPLWLKKKRMLHSARRTATFFKLNNTQTGLLCLPSKFIGGRMMLVRAMVSGMKIHSVKPELNPLKNALPEPVYFAAFTPAQVSEIMKNEESRQRFEQIKFVIIGGAPLNNRLENELAQCTNTVYITYGMTETVSHIAVRKIGQPLYMLISPAIEIGVNENNCLWIKDENLSDKVIQTGDVVKLISQNSFEWQGRIDFAINSGGIKIHPEQAEHKIRQLPLWAERHFFMTSQSDPTFGERPVLVVEETNEYIDLSDIEKVLTKHEIPEVLFVVPQFIYTNTGKVNRTETYKMARQLNSQK